MYYFLRILSFLWWSPFFSQRPKFARTNISTSNNSNLNNVIFTLSFSLFLLLSSLTSLTIMCTQDQDQDSIPGAWERMWLCVRRVQQRNKISPISQYNGVHFNLRMFSFSERLHLVLRSRCFLHFIMAIISIIITILAHVALLMLGAAVIVVVINFRSKRTENKIFSTWNNQNYVCAWTLNIEDERNMKAKISSKKIERKIRNDVFPTWKAHRKSNVVCTIWASNTFVLVRRSNFVRIM